MSRTPAVSVAILVVLGLATFAAAQEPAAPASQLQLARTYASSGRYYEAATIAKSLLARDPADAEAAAILSDATSAMRELHRQQLEAAREAASRPEATDADKLALANAWYDAGEYENASALYAQLPVSLVSDDVRLRRARALAWSSHYDEAEQLYDEILRAKTTPELQVEYGRLLSWMGATAASVRTLDEAYRASPTEEAAVALANAHAWGGDRDAAVSLLAEFTTAHPESVDAHKLLVELQGSPDLRLEQIDRLIRDEPYNLALHVERARLLYNAGRYATALNEIAFIRKASRTPVEGVDQLARDAEERRTQEIARLDERRSRLSELAASPVMISGSTHADDERLSLAKAYTGQAAYDQAIALYEDYLKANPSDMTARIAYARVLSWDRRYTDAQRQYEKLLEHNPDRADLQYEYAQTLSYDADFVPATRQFRTLTDLSNNPRARLYPDVPQRAHFNLGQIYRWYGWNDAAVREQNAALAIDEKYTDAREELEHARTARPSSQYGVTYGFLEDSSDLQFRRVDLEGSQWLSQRTAIQGGIGRHDFDRGDASAHAVSANVGALHRFEDRFTGRARVGVNHYDQDLGTRPFYGVGVDWLPNLQTSTAFDYNHYDLVYDVFTLASLGADGSASTPGPDALDIDDFRGHFDYQSGGFWSVLGDASYGMISDDNNRQALHGLASFRLLRSPFVAVKADGRYLSYDHRSNRYWSPEDYRSLAGVLHVGGEVKQRFYWALEGKAGRSYERDRTSDIRTINATLRVPVAELFDVVGSYTYGKSGRFDNVLGGSGEDFTNYWQRQWYVGISMRRLFARDDRHAPDHYYYDNRVLTGSPVIPPVGETR